MADADPVAELLAEGRIEKIGVDQAAVQRVLRQSSLNIQGARRELEAGNPGGAYALLWDAVRLAIAAHMAAKGLRTTSRPGHHAAVTTYARTRLAGVVGEVDLELLDQMRRTRNLTEYGARPVTRPQATEHLRVASRIVQAIITAMRPPARD